MKFIKHIRNTDVCFEVFTSIERSSGALQVTGLWWNIVMGDPFPLLGTRETVQIKKEDRPDWKPYEPRST